MLKKSNFLILFILFTSIAIAQQDYQYLVKTEVIDENDYVSFRTEYSYDTQNRLIENISYSTPPPLEDLRTQDLDYITKVTYLYDDIWGNLSSEIHSIFNATLNIYDPDYKKNYYYNSQNLISKYISYSYDPNSTNWIANNRDSMVYNNSNLLTHKYLHSLQSNNTWKPICVWEYSYNNTSNLLEEEIYKKYDNISLNYENNSKITYNYDNQGQLTERISTFFNKATSTWNNTYKNSLSYDSDGHLVEFSLLEWNNQTNQWEYADSDNCILISKQVFQYENNGNLSHIFNYLYRNGQFELRSENENLYDNSYSYQELVLPREANYYTSMYSITLTNRQMFKHQLLLKNYTLYDHGQTYHGRTEYTYQSTAGAPEIQNNNISVYPNPAQSIINIKGLEDSKVQFRLFDTLGKQILSATNRLSINIQHLPSGVYTYHLISNSGVKTGVLIKN